MEFLLSIIKWLSQVLILIVGVSALLSDPYRKNEETGRRTLTRSGWIHIAMIAVGFILFGISDYAERQEKTEKAKQSAAQIEIQKKMIGDQKILIDSQANLAQTQQDVLKTQQKQVEDQKTVIDSQATLAHTQQDVLKNQQQQIADQQIQLSQSKQLDLARYRLAGLDMSLPSRRKGAYQKLLEVFSEACTLELNGRSAMPRTIRPCFEAEPQRHLCAFEISRTANDKIVVNVSKSGSLSLSIHVDNNIWKLVSKIIRSTVYRNLEIVDDSGAALVTLTDDSFITMFSLKKGEIHIDLEGLNLRLDQLSNNHFTFKMVGYVEGVSFIPFTMRLNSADPHVVWDQTFELKEPRQGRTLLYEDGLTGDRGFESEHVFGPYPLTVRFRK